MFKSPELTAFVGGSIIGAAGSAILELASNHAALHPLEAAKYVGATGLISGLFLSLATATVRQGVRFINTPIRPFK